MKKSIILVMSLLLLAGCQQSNKVSCESPLINIAGECCLDNDKNSICDDLEKENLAAKQRMDTSKKIEGATKFSPNYITLDQLEDAINKTYYPIKRFNFEDINESNLTDFEATYDIRSIGRFTIIKIRRDYNFLQNEVNFTNFIKTKYRLDVKNNDINSEEFIDYRGIYYPTWQGATYTYDHDIQETKIMGKPAFFEKHIVIYGIDDSLLDLWFSYGLNVWCTPELVVVVPPRETFVFYYDEGNAVQANVKHIGKLMKEQDKFMLQEAEKILKICSGQVEPLKLKPGEFVFYGNDGFYPTESKIRAGEKVIIHNENDFNNAEIFTFMGKKTPAFISGEINYTGFGEIAIEKADDYTILNPQYEGRARIIVG